MGKTRDKNHLGVSLTNSKKQVKLTKSQKSRVTASKALGASSVTDQSNLNEVIDKLDYITMMSSNQVPEEDEDADSDEYEDISDEEASDSEDDYDDTELVESAAVGDACLVVRDPESVSFY